MVKKRKIAVVLIDRANYGRLKPVMKEMAKRPEIELQVVLSGTMLLERFGMAKNVVVRDGFQVNEEVYMELEGSVPETMAQSIGLGVIQFSNTFQKLNPDFILLIGDRYEALSAAIAAIYQNFCLIHMQGGEVTGSIDETTRHVISKMAHYHFPATKRAGEYVVAMGEDPKTVFALGCPSADVVARAIKDIPKHKLDKLGVGPALDLYKPFILVIFHPVTTEFNVAESQMQEVLGAIRETGLQTILLWPNIDAGSDGVSKAIRRFREFNHDFPMRAYKNFESEVYIPILARTACAVGNSSSFIRDASFLGTPVVLVGSRQDGREFCDAVHHIAPEKGAIVRAIKRQLSNGRYRPSELYGVPGVSKKIVEELVKIEPYMQKRIHYVSK